MKNPPILIAVLGFFAALAGFGHLFFGLLDGLVRLLRLGLVSVGVRLAALGGHVGQLFGGVVQRR